VISSMTGYGRKEISTSAGNQLTIEIRSVNNRYIDIQVKAPRSLAALEPRIKKAVQDRFSRGRFDVFIVRSSEHENGGKLTVDETIAGQYVTVLKNLKDRLGLSGDIDLQLLSSLPGLISVSEQNEDIEEIWISLSEGLDQALGGLHRMRVEEGKSLLRDMIGRIDSIEERLQTVHSLAPAVVELARKRLSETVARLVNVPPDPVRLAQEIAILAERTDVTEELTRLASHIGQFRILTSEKIGEPVGRKLDFLLQEMGRETNTIASKAMNSQIAHHVVDIKAELEKIREQVQNIE
jgi:uncharacterized protein (TIGR00255 family)